MMSEKGKQIHRANQPARARGIECAERCGLNCVLYEEHGGLFDYCVVF